MFREFMGLPAHALVVHAAVVFVPLLALISTGYALLPRFRARIGWAAAGLAVIAPASALFAKLSGDELRDVLIAKNYPAEIIQQVNEHQRYGDLTFWFSLGLGLATALLLVVTSRHPRVQSAPGWLGLVLGGVVMLLAVVSVIYVYLTGDSGAQAVWQGIL